VTERSLYEHLGGEAGVRKLVDRFYDLMDQLPECQGIRRMHPDDLSTSREKLFEFLSGWTGGPQLFVQKRGHPMLRRRHFPFPIGESERDQWMTCMLGALGDHPGLDPTARDQLATALARLADHMRNREG
jgi:hemoglobin